MCGASRAPRGSPGEPEGVRDSRDPEGATHQKGAACLPGQALLSGGRDCGKPGRLTGPTAPRKGSGPHPRSLGPAAAGRSTGHRRVLRAPRQAGQCAECRRCRREVGRTPGPEPRGAGQGAKYSEDLPRREWRHPDARRKGSGDGHSALKLEASRAPQPGSAAGHRPRAGAAASQAGGQGRDSRARLTNEPGEHGPRRSAHPPTGPGLRPLLRGRPCRGQTAFQDLARPRVFGRRLPGLRRAGGPERSLDSGTLTLRTGEPCQCGRSSLCCHQRRLL